MTERTDLMKRCPPASGLRATGPRSGWVRALALAAVVGALLGVVSGCESTEAARSELLTLVNESRARAGVGSLERNVQLDVKADAWAQRLRDVCQLSHSTLSDGAPENWYKLGENVGYGGTIRDVHRGFLDSPGHRANMLDPSFSLMGSAAVSGECGGYLLTFVVTVFMQPAAR